MAQKVYGQVVNGETLYSVGDGPPIYKNVDDAKRAAGAYVEADDPNHGRSGGWPRPTGLHIAVWLILIGIVAYLGLADVDLSKKDANQGQTVPQTTTYPTSQTIQPAIYRPQSQPITQQQRELPAGCYWLDQHQFHCPPNVRR